MRTILVSLAVLLAAPIARAQNDAPSPPPEIGSAWRGFRVLHAPLHEAHTGSLDLPFYVDGADRAGRIVVVYRLADGTEHEAEVRTTPSGPSVHLDAITPPGFDYWIVRVVSDHEEPVFASRELPQRVLVRDGARAAEERQGLASVGGHRSRLGASFEWVDFGHRNVGASIGLPDQYWHASASYAYSFFDVVESIRVEGGSFRGSVGDVSAARAAGTAPIGGHEVGLDYGRAEITWFLLPIFRLRTSVLFGYSQRGFEGGGAGALLIGDPFGALVELGCEGVSGVGLTARARLSWYASPWLPMGSTIEVTNFPAGEDFGVRLLFDIGLVMYPGAILRVRGGYQSRTAVTGGASIGGELVFAF
jgi:hypothetical protein